MLLPTAARPRCKAASRCGRGSPTQTIWTTCTATSHRVGCKRASTCLVYQAHLTTAQRSCQQMIGLYIWHLQSHRHPNPFNALLRTAPPCAAPAGSDLRCYNDIQNEAYGASERPGWRHYQSPVAEIKPLQAASIAYTFPAEQVGGCMRAPQLFRAQGRLGADVQAVFVLSAAGCAPALHHVLLVTQHLPCLPSAGRPAPVPRLGTGGGGAVGGVSAARWLPGQGPSCTAPLRQPLCVLCSLPQRLCCSLLDAHCVRAPAVPVQLARHRCLQPILTRIAVGPPRASPQTSAASQRTPATTWLSSCLGRQPPTGCSKW